MPRPACMLRVQIPSIGIIGGSGLYNIDGLHDTTSLKIDTSFGPPSDVLVGGVLEGRQIYFLPRHGRRHRLLPHEINHRANLWALRSLGVRYVICVTAVGSLHESYAPGHILLPDQFYDRTSAVHTFFGDGIVAHVSLAEPVSGELRTLLQQAAQACGCTVHDGGTYVNMSGPGFSTRAESEAYRHLGFDVIGMTNLAEVKLAREAEMALATLCMVTDYDCWKQDEAPVTAAEVGKRLHANACAAREIIKRCIASIPTHAAWPEHRSLDAAIMTPRAQWPEVTVERLAPLLERFL